MSTEIHPSEELDDPQYYPPVDPGNRQADTATSDSAAELGASDSQPAD